MARAVLPFLRTGCARALLPGFSGGGAACRPPASASPHPAPESGLRLQPAPGASSGREEPAANRGCLAALCEAYDEEALPNGETRVVLRLKPALAPVKVAVLPLKKNTPPIVALAKEIKNTLQGSGEMRAVYDDSAGIGKLYRRQDEVGTPFCVTVDFKSLEDRTVTVRDRDTMEQIRLPVDDLLGYVRERI